jgi:hypothetical protein
MKSNSITLPIGVIVETTQSASSIINETEHRAGFISCTNDCDRKQVLNKQNTDCDGRVKRSSSTLFLKGLRGEYAAGKEYTRCYGPGCRGDTAISD